MKASEVLRRYETGERNFQRVNLRGQSFMGKDLSGADFSEADIRSANFTGANLRGANFTGAKCGLQKRWATLLVLFSWLLAGISGFLSIFVGTLVSLIFDDSSLENQIGGLVSLLVLVVFLIVVICRGIGAGAVAVAVAVAVAFAVAVAVAVAGAGVGGAAVAFVVAGAFAVAFAGAFAGAFAVAFAVAGAFAVAVAVAFAVAFARAVAGAFAGAGAFAVAVVGVYIAWRALKGDKRDAWVRSLAIATAAIGGTSFRNADLTDANFRAAQLKSTDLREAILTRVRWYGAKKLERVRPGDTYLQDAQVREWLLGKGEDKNFDRQQLRGINLQGANLTDASFIGADLSEANLQDTDLSRAKLVQTQLDETDLTGATLTGAFIEDWGITSSTVVNGVRCEYVFMRLPTKEDPAPCRKPDNRSEVFEDGDFADFIKPIVQTLDLYHNQGVDPRAIAISWKKLAENNPDAQLRFASMEVKGKDNLLLRLKTAPEVDKSQLSAEYFNTYNQLKTLAEAESKKLLAEKDDRIQKLENMVDTALKRPSFYAENYQGDTSLTGEQHKIAITGGTINASGAGAFSLGDIYGTVANKIEELPSSSNPHEPGIKELLTQLYQAINAPDLSQNDKKDALDQLKVLAEAGKNHQDASSQKKAERAVSILEVITKGVEPATKLAQTCTKVLPKILAFFGL